MSSPAQPHDHFFKHLFSDPRLVLSYLKGSLPAAWFARLEGESLTKLPDSYVDEQLQEQLTDVVYQCQVRDREHPVNLVFLLEHKSYVPTYPHLQLLRYMLNLWEKQVRTGKPLSPIIPMVVYHGRHDWEVKRFEEYLSIQGEGWLRQYLPDFSYHLTNLRRESDDQIEQQYEALILRKAFLLMKWVFQKGLSEQAKRIFEEILAAPADQPESKYFRIFITYLSNSPNPEKDQTMANVKSLVEEWDLPTDSLAYQWIQEIEQKGLERGIKKGIERGLRISILKMLNKGFPAGEVAEILEVPLELVQQVATE